MARTRSGLPPQAPTAGSHGTLSSGSTSDPSMVVGSGSIPDLLAPVSSPSMDGTAVPVIRLELHLFNLHSELRLSPLLVALRLAILTTSMNRSIEHLLSMLLRSTRLLV
uniref:Uncharacterized protein n=1 Tax=Cannabis sativa TaxID=3483 RepID=A0A803QR70_CANSA